MRKHVAVGAVTIITLATGIGVFQTPRYAHAQDAQEARAFLTFFRIDELDRGRVLENCANPSMTEASLQRPRNPPVSGVVILCERR